jgi:predicted lipid-binding transport protein (Tim44 family)
MAEPKMSEPDVGAVELSFQALRKKYTQAQLDEVSDYLYCGNDKGDLVDFVMHFHHITGQFDELYKEVKELRELFEREDEAERAVTVASGTGV